MSVRYKLFILSIIILGINVALGYAVYESGQKLLDSEQWVQHTERVIIQTSNIRSLAREMQITSRDFLITDDSVFLEPLKHAKIVAFSYIGQLKQLTRDNPTQQKLIDSLNLYMHKLENFSSKTIEARKKQGLASVIAYTADKQRKQYTNRITQITNAIQADEDALYNLRKQTYSRDKIVSNQFTVAVFILMAGLTVFLMIVVGKYLFQNKEKRKRAAELGVAQEELSFQNEEKVKRTDELKKVNRLYTFLSQVNQNISRVKNEGTLFKNACNIAFKFGHFKIAWVGLFDHEYKKVTITEQTGILDADVQMFKDVPLTFDGPQQYVLRNGNYFLSNDVLNDPALELWQSLAKKYDIQSCIVLPIRKSGNITGTFNLYSAELDFFNNEEIALLVELAGDISFALDLFEKEKIHDYTQQLVAQNEKRFRALIEKSADMIILSNKDGEVFYGSPSISSVLGYSTEEFLDKSITDIIHPDDVSEYVANRNKVLKTPGDSFQYEHRRRDKNGNWIWCEGILTNMLHEPGVQALVSNFRDITDKKIREQQRQFDKNNLDALINNTDDLMWSVDKNFGLITSNHPFDEFVRVLTGTKIINGTNILSSAYPAEQLTQYQNFYERAFAGESFTEVVCNADPVEIWSEISYCPIRIGDSVIGTACHSRDITERVRAERRLSKSEAFNRGVLNSLTSHIAVIDYLGNIIAVNESWKRFALENGEITLQGTSVGSNYFDICEKSAKDGEEIAAEALHGLKNVFNEKVPIFYLEYPCHSPSEKRWFGMRAIKFESDDKMVVIAHQNITERKLAEVYLLKSESSLKEAQNIGQIGNYEVDMINNSEAWSDQMYSILGIDNRIGDKLVPSNELLSAFIHPDDFAKVMNASKTHLDDSMDYRLLLKDGSLRYVYSEWKFEFDKNKKPTRLYGILQDITERKLAEIERRRIVRELTQRNKELEQFAYIISHNLRAPVANIMGASNALNEIGLSNEERVILKKGIHTAVIKIDDVIHDLNQILQVKSNINEIKQVVNFSGLVDDIKTSMSHLIDRDDIEIKYDFPDVNEYFTVKPYLYSIFLNLISNSVKYRQPGNHCVIEIMSHLLKDKIELVFSDNGMGIDLGKKGQEVFGLYKRFHANIDGKGIGLFMVKTQVETLGGKISIKSEENVGTEFKIEFEI